MYHLWHTEHEINHTVMRSFKTGLAFISESGDYPIKHVSRWNGEKNNITYGILRGADRVFKQSNEYWEIDRGYFHPHHYDGYYRISLNGTRAAYREDDALTLSPDRWRSFGIKVAEWQPNPHGYVLVCPPTFPVMDFYGLEEDWGVKVAEQVRAAGLVPRIRGKDSVAPLRDELRGARCVVTYNSNVAIDALLAGIPVIAHSPDIYNWNGLEMSDITGDLTRDRVGRPLDRERLFTFLSWCQFTLKEFQTGKPWQISLNLQKYGGIEWPVAM